MAIYALQMVEVIEVMENYIANRRPPEEMRNQLDMNYNIEGQSVIIFAIRPLYN